MEKKLYINKEEREKCRNVVNAYAEEFDDETLLVLEAGRFGFITMTLTVLRTPLSFTTASACFKIYGKSGFIYSF